MDIISLKQNNFLGLSANYPYDNTLQLKQDNFYTDQGIYVSVNNILKNINDNKINNYSNVFLTGQDSLNNSLEIKKLDNLEDEGFSTFFGCNALGTITSTSRFWVVDEPPINTNVAGLVVTGIYTDLNNKSFFDVELLSDKYCKIIHENNGIIRYLTIDYTGNLSFCKDVNLDSLGEYSPQIFYYVYDRKYDYIIFIKNVNDIGKFITYSSENQDLILTDPLTGSAVPYSTASILRIRNRNEDPNNTKLFDPWVSYNKNFKTNTLDINEQRSFTEVKSNLLLNNEYYNISENKKSLDLNILSLKNTNTAEYYQSRGNPFFDEENVLFRDYKSLFTGSNQIQGNDNITINYETYTTSILLKKDKVTYFHVPQVFYPYVRLNINNSNLVNAGAIAGDHPLKADKIFKKRADYKYSSHFGQTIDETIGSFLCSWLSGNNNINSKPVWVDRYFNPKRASFITALTASNYKAVKYISLFDCITDKANQLLGPDVEIFDKPSDLVFEPGTYYAYYHYGPRDVDNFIKTFSKTLIQNDFTEILNTNGSTTFTNVGSEYDINGSNYLVSNTLSAIQDSNQFTLLFDCYNDDWSKPFGYQILGNFNRDGFGIFNQNLVTPTVMFNSNSALIVTNTDFKILNTVELYSNISGVIRQNGLNDTYLILKDNTIRRYNMSYAETRKITPYDNAKIGQLYGVDYDDENAFILYNNNTPPNVTVEIKKLNLKTNELDNSTNLIEPARGITNPNVWRTINVYNEKVFVTDGSKSVRVGKKIFYQTNNSIRMWSDIGESTSKDFIAFTSSTIINDFTIDFDQNLWILFDNNKYAKYSNNREFLLSGYFSDTSYKNYSVFGIAEFKNSSYIKNVAIARYSPSLQKYSITTIDGEAQANTTLFKCVSSLNNNLTNSQFLVNNSLEKYPESNLNFIAKLINVYNSNDIETAELIFNLSGLDPGYHNFALRFDSYRGFMHLFVDGQVISYTDFKPRKYKFSNLINRPFLIGTSNYSYGIPLFNYLKKPDLYMSSNLKIKNFYLYSKPLNDFDIMFHTRKGLKINDIKFDIACGRRNYLEEIERYFKIDPPGSKSTLYNIVLRNTNIKDPSLRYALEQRIIQILNTSAPAYSKLNRIIWVN